MSNNPALIMAIDVPTRDGAVVRAAIWDGRIDFYGGQSRNRLRVIGRTIAQLKTMVAQAPNSDGHISIGPETISAAAMLVVINWAELIITTQEGGVMNNG